MNHPWPSLQHRTLAVQTEQLVPVARGILDALCREAKLRPSDFDALSTILAETLTSDPETIVRRAVEPSRQYYTESPDDFDIELRSRIARALAMFLPEDANLWLGALADPSTAIRKPVDKENLQRLFRFLKLAVQSGASGMPDYHGDHRLLRDAGILGMLRPLLTPAALHTAAGGDYQSIHEWVYKTSPHLAADPAIKGRLSLLLDRMLDGGAHFSMSVQLGSLLHAATQGNCAVDFSMWATDFIDYFASADQEQLMQFLGAHHDHALLDTLTAIANLNNAASFRTNNADLATRIAVHDLKSMQDEFCSADERRTTGMLLETLFEDHPQIPIATLIYQVLKEESVERFGSAAARITNAPVDIATQTAADLALKTLIVLRQLYVDMQEKIKNDRDYAEQMLEEDESAVYLEELADGLEELGLNDDKLNGGPAHVFYLFDGIADNIAHTPSERLASELGALPLLASTLRGHLDHLPDLYQHLSRNGFGTPGIWMPIETMIALINRTDSDPIPESIEA